MNLPVVVTAVAVIALVLVEIGVFLNWYRQRRSLPPSGVPGRSHGALELAWALGPVALLAILVILTFQALSGPSIPAGPGTVPVDTPQGGGRR